MKYFDPKVLKYIPAVNSSILLKDSLGRFFIHKNVPLLVNDVGHVFTPTIRKMMGDLPTKLK